MNHIIGFHPTAKFKKSFSLKLMAILLACMSVVIIFTSIIYYQSSSRLIQREYVRSTQQLLKEVSQNLERYYTQLDNVTRSLYNDDDFIDNLRFKRNDYASVLYNESIVKSLLFRGLGSLSHGLLFWRHNPIESTKAKKQHQFIKK